ncbi:glycosyltransferase family 4 protein [Jatrophihabitans sp. YIM 134969]
MRVTMPSWEFPPLVVGGLGRHVDGLSRALAAGGTSVEVVTRGAPEVPAQETRDKVEVLRARADEIEVGFAVESLLAWASSADHALLRAALPRVLANPPDVVHAHDWLVAQSAVTLAQAAGVPLVTTIHATEWGRHRGHLTTPLRRAVDSVERWLVHQSERVVVCSQAMRSEVVDRLGADPARVDVVTGGVDADAWGGRRPARAPGRPPVLLFAGRVEWEKGLQTVVEALPALRRAVPGVTLRVAGDGAYLDEVRALARRRRVASAVTWLGRRSDTDLAAEYRAADVVVVPSLYEPYGLVALEAAAAGTPRVVAATGGLAEQVRDGVSGVVVEPGDVAAWVAALRSVLADPDRARRLAAAARRDARRRHGWDVVAAATSEVYARALG